MHPYASTSSLFENDVDYTQNVLRSESAYFRKGLIEDISERIYRNPF